MLSDPFISDLHRVRRIYDSLLPPATDVVKHVCPPALPGVCHGSWVPGPILTVSCLCACAYV